MVRHLFHIRATFPVAEPRTTSLPRRLIVVLCCQQRNPAVEHTGSKEGEENSEFTRLGCTPQDPGKPMHCSDMITAYGASVRFRWLLSTYDDARSTPQRFRLVNASSGGTGTRPLSRCDTGLTIPWHNPAAPTEQTVEAVMSAVLISSIRSHFHTASTENNVG